MSSEDNPDINVCDRVLLSFLKNNKPRCGNYGSGDQFWDTWIHLAIADGIFKQHNIGYYKPIISLTERGFQKAKELALIHSL